MSDPKIPDFYLDELSKPVGMGVVPSEPTRVGITDAQVNEDEFVHVDQLNDSLFFVSATQYDMICHFLSFCNVHDINNLDELKEFTFHSLGKGFELKYREPQI